MAKGENIFLRKDGRFEGRYAKGRDSNGKLIYGFCYGRTYEEAKEKVCRARKKIGNIGAPPMHQGRTFACYCNKWLAVNSNRLKASSHAKYRADIKNHIMPFFGGILPDDITSEEVDDFTQTLLCEKHLSAKTVRNILALFHSIFLYTKKRAGKNIPEIEIIYPREHRKNIRVLDKAEEETLVLFLAEEMDLCKFGVYMALRTGLRIGELCALRWNDISTKACTISIIHTAQRIKKADIEDYAKTEMVIGTPKSESSCRTIPLMPDLAALCMRFKTKDPEAFILTGTRQCMDPRKLQRRLKSYTEKCQIQEVHFHTLRHTFATRCIEVGFDVKTLSEILGHSNISITLNQYVHPSLERKRENMSHLKTVIRLSV